MMMTKKKKFRKNILVDTDHSSDGGVIVFGVGCCCSRTPTFRELFHSSGQCLKAANRKSAH